MSAEPNKGVFLLKMFNLNHFRGNFRNTSPVFQENFTFSSASFHHGFFWSDSPALLRRAPSFAFLRESCSLLIPLSFLVIDGTRAQKPSAKILERLDIYWLFRQPKMLENLEGLSNFAVRRPTQ
jgi:hypothetical protein